MVLEIRNVIFRIQKSVLLNKHNFLQVPAKFFLRPHFYEDPFIGNTEFNCKISLKIPLWTELVRQERKKHLETSSGSAGVSFNLKSVSILRWGTSLRHIVIDSKGQKSEKGSKSLWGESETDYVSSVFS